MELPERQYYIYVLLNDAGNIKIGITQNFSQRLQSLSGSNGGGHKIIDYYVSPPTYLMSLEKAFHIHFHQYRIGATDEEKEKSEWFHGISFPEVVDFVKETFNKPTYPYTNANKKNYYLMKAGYPQEELPDIVTDKDDKVKEDKE